MHITQIKEVREELMLSIIGLSKNPPDKNEVLKALDAAIHQIETFIDSKDRLSKGTK